MTKGYFIKLGRCCHLARCLCPGTQTHACQYGEAAGSPPEPLTCRAAARNDKDAPSPGLGLTAAWERSLPLCLPFLGATGSIGILLQSESRQAVPKAQLSHMVYCFIPISRAVVQPDYSL